MRKINLFRKATASAKRKATNSAKQTLYMMIWKEKPPKGKKII